MSTTRTQPERNSIRVSDDLAFFFFQAEDGIRDYKVTGVQTCALPIFMVLREPDVLPLGDVGLERAITSVYGRKRNVERLGEKWRPFRSVACWYLWRKIGRASCRERV